MLSTLLAIFIVLSVLGAVGYFIINYWDYLSSAWDWALMTIQALIVYVPDWLLPVFFAALLVAAVCLFVRLA